MNNIDKIYELIKKDNSINTFTNNMDLFQEFYYHNMSIKYNGTKVIDIYKYLLSLNLSEEHETMPYLNSKIFQDFNKYEMTITQSVYMNNTTTDDNYVNLLFELIKNYFEFKIYENQSNLDKLVSKNQFIRDCTGAMMVILNKSFFKISNENITKMMELVKNNDYLKQIIDDGKIGKQLLDIDYIFQYTSRFLFNVQFVNQENIKNDLLMNAIKDGKIKDKKTLTKIFKNTNIYFILSIFNDELSSVIDSLEKSIENEFDRIDLFRIIYNKLIEEQEFRMILKFVMTDNRSNIYINDGERKNIINKVSGDYPINITEEEINYILNQEINELFLINLKKDYKNNNWSEQTQNKVKEATENIKEYNFDFETAIKVLETLFNGSKEVNIIMIISTLERLIKNYLNTEDVKVYVTNDNTINGCAYTGDKCIKINYSLIKKILETHNYEEDPESIRILETVFHEARHLEQFNYMKDENMSDDIYNQYKEEIISCINEQYYTKNYIGVSFEKDARVIGTKMVSLLLKEYFPFMEENISHYEEKSIKESEKEIKNKTIFELSESLTVDEALEKLLTINPQIIEQFTALKREYNFDGSKKEYTEQRTQKSFYK